MIGVENSQFLASLLELLKVDVDGVSGSGLNRGNVQLLQIATVSGQSLEDKRQSGQFVIGKVQIGKSIAENGDKFCQAGAGDSAS